MLHHIVIWKLKAEAEGHTASENAGKLKSLLEALPAEIKEIKKLQVGINIPELPYADADIVLVSEFDNEHDLKIYQEHPKHKAIAEFVGKIRETRSCVDYVV